MLSWWGGCSANGGPNPRGSSPFSPRQRHGWCSKSPCHAPGNPLCHAPGNPPHQASPQWVRVLLGLIRGSTGATKNKDGIGWWLSISSARPLGQNRASATAPLLPVLFLTELRKLFAALFQPWGFSTRCGFLQVCGRRMHTERAGLGGSRLQSSHQQEIPALMLGSSCKGHAS